MANNRYFYLSGLISLSLFVLFLVLFVMILLQQEKLKQFALKKDNYISVSIDTPLVNKKSVKKNLKQVKSKLQEKPKEKPADKPETKPLVKPAEKPKAVNKNISDLFASVKTQKISHKANKKPVYDKKLLSKLSKKSVKKSVTQKSAAASALKKIEISSESASTSPDVNEYLAKIQAIIYEHFYPPMNSEGLSAIVTITFNSSGKITSYRVLNYSGNEMFNSEVDMLQARLKALTFAKHPEGKSESVKIILTSQE
ncbi:MAG: TonB C-terminal domain-containing protein [Campylobacterota bacterium]|nr:TonB C-terminal domain-containing protein [Campylobacterota bacterium]